MVQEILSINQRELFIQLFNYLHQVNYQNIKKFPLRKYPIQKKTIINEFANIIRFTFCRNNIFSISMNPQMYQSFSFNMQLKKLHKVFFLNKIISKNNYVITLNDWLEQAIIAGLVQLENDDHIQFLYRIVPYHDLLLVTSRFNRNDTTFTYISYDSLFFAEFLTKQLEKNEFNYKSSLDIGCGVGIISFIISKYCSEVCGLDLNPSSINLAQLNAELNKVTNCQFIIESFMSLRKQSYDLITANPPFIHYPDTSSGPLDSDGEEPYGLGITMKIIQKIPELLKEEGIAFILTRSPVISGKDFLFSELSDQLPEGFSWVYHDLSDSVGSLESFEEFEGIESYRHVIVEIINDGKKNQKKVTYPFFYRRTNLF